MSSCLRPTLGLVNTPWLGEKVTQLNAFWDQRTFTERCYFVPPGPLSMTQRSICISSFNTQDKHPLWMRAWGPLECQPLLLKSLKVLRGNATEFLPSRLMNWKLLTKHLFWWLLLDTFSTTYLNFRSTHFENIFFNITKKPSNNPAPTVRS